MLFWNIGQVDLGPIRLNKKGVYYFLNTKRVFRNRKPLKKVSWQNFVVFLVFSHKNILGLLKLGLYTRIFYIPDIWSCETDQYYQCSREVRDEGERTVELAPVHPLM